MTYKIILFLAIVLYFPILVIIAIYSLAHIYITGHDFTNDKIIQIMVKPLDWVYELTKK